MVVSAAI